MVVRLFHQNMLNWGGTARASDFIDAFGKIRTEPQPLYTLGTDTVLAAGFTEITNIGTILTTHMRDMCDKMEPPVLNVSQFREPILFAAGTDINGNLYEYLAIVVNQAATVNAAGYTFIYVNKDDGQDYIIYATSNTDTTKFTTLPQGPVYNDGKPYYLANNYRCLAFVDITYNGNTFIIGFMHNVCWAGEPGVVINQIPAFMRYTAESLNRNVNTPIIIGGDFNTYPREISGGDGFNDVNPYFATLLGKNIFTTSSSCIDFWLSNTNTIDNNTMFSNTGCKVHPQAYLTKDLITKNRITDHKAISMQIL